MRSFWGSVEPDDERLYTVRHKMPLEMRRDAKPGNRIAALMILALVGMAVLVAWLLYASHITEPRAVRHYDMRECDDGQLLLVAR